MATIPWATTGFAFRPSDGVLFGVTSNNSAANPRRLITVDPSTGIGTDIGALGLANGISDITFRSDDVLFGYGAGTHLLYTINQGTSVPTQVSGTPVITGGSFGNAMAFDSTDVLHLFPKGDDGLWYTVDDSTAVATSQGTLTGSPFGGGGTIGAACFDATDVLWIFDYDFVSQSWLCTFDLGTDTISGVGQTTTFMDALAVDLP